jgi:hypothetical protein
MSDLKSAAKLALEALEGLKSLYGGNGHKLHEINMIHRKHDTAITALKEVLKEHAMQEMQRLGQEIEQESVGMVKDLFTSTAWEKLDVRGSTKVYLDIPPQRTWVGLTDDEKDHLIGLHIRVAQGAVDAWIEGLDDFIQAIEAKLKQKNGFAEEKNT